MMQKKVHQWKPTEALRRAVHIETGLLLHMGGSGHHTHNRDYSWKGTTAQFSALDLNPDDYRLIMPSADVLSLEITDRDDAED